jgi:hypothetical protein
MLSKTFQQYVLQQNVCQIMSVCKMSYGQMSVNYLPDNNDACQPNVANKNVCQPNAY